jgi:glutaredoxin-like protein NrdH
MTTAATRLAVTVYTTPACGGCRLTKMQLDKRGIPFEPVEIDPNNQQLMASFLELGYGPGTSAPIVVADTPDGPLDWSGYRPDAIDALKRYL